MEKLATDPGGEFRHVSDGSAFIMKKKKSFFIKR